MALQQKKIDTKMFVDGTQQITFQYHRENKKCIKASDVEKIITNAETDGKKKHKRFRLEYVRVLNGDKWMSFKSYEDYIDYFNNVVRETTKFEEIYQLTIAVTVKN